MDVKDASLLVLAVAWGASGILIYADATRYNIGKIKGQESGFFKNWRASDWAFCSMSLAPLVSLVYLLKRKQLIENAKVHPVRVTPAKKIAMFLLLGFLELVVILQAIDYYQMNKFRPTSLEKTYDPAHASQK